MGLEKLKFRYLERSDEEVVKEIEKRLKEIKGLLAQIKDLLKAAGGVEEVEQGKDGGL